MSPVPVRCPLCPNLDTYTTWRGVLRHIIIDHHGWEYVPESRAREIVEVVSGAQPYRRANAAVCATRGGYRRHLRRGEIPCEPCYEAYREWKKSERAKQKQPPRPRVAARCGTRSGYQVHQRRGEPPCPACYVANANYNRDYYETRRSA